MKLRIAGAPAEEELYLKLLEDGNEISLVVVGALGNERAVAGGILMQFFVCDGKMRGALGPSIATDLPIERDFRDRLVVDV